MLTFIIIGALSLVALYFGSSLFVQGAAQSALHLRLPKGLVGLVLVSFATSAPELFTSVDASLQGWTDIALGNVVGSNIANLTLVLGALILAKPVSIHLADEKVSCLFLVAACFLLPVVTWDHRMDRWEGAFLFFGLIVFLFYTYKLTRQHNHAPSPSSTEESRQTAILEHISSAHISPVKAAFAFLGGLVILLSATHGLLWSATHIAQIYGISDLIIGLTIVAIGTSLPELAASLVGVWKKEEELAIGNIIGSNIFNVFGVAGVAILVNPGTVNATLNYRDIPIMIFLLLLVFSMILLRRGKRIGRLGGGILLTCFICYQFALYLYASSYVTS